MQLPIGKKRMLWGWSSDYSIDASGHSFFIGKTGTGKSTVLESIFLQSIRSGLGGCFIDPHGLSADTLAQKIPRWRTNDVVWFDPTAEAVPGLNPLEGQNRDLRLDQFIDILAHFYGSSSWLARSDYISRNLGAAVLELVPQCTPLHISRAFVDDAFRAQLAARTGQQLYDFYTTLIDDADLDIDTFLILVNVAKNRREDMRPWQYLKKPSTASAATGTSQRTTQSMTRSAAASRATAGRGAATTLRDRLFVDFMPIFQHPKRSRRSA
ncbi:MAG TPA: hypothetical protein VJ276_03190 [Thermoanaerobaculia bacterium]|nr:hypothetical protein [Thermoanaerobaculia bacterium]